MFLSTMARVEAAVAGLRAVLVEWGAVDADLDDDDIRRLIVKLRGRCNTEPSDLGPDGSIVSLMYCLHPLAEMLWNSSPQKDDMSTEECAQYLRAGSEQALRYTPWKTRFALALDMAS